MLPVERACMETVDSKGGGSGDSEEGNGDGDGGDSEEDNGDGEGDGDDDSDGQCKFDGFFLRLVVILDPQWHFGSMPANRLAL